MLRVFNSKGTMSHQKQEGQKKIKTTNGAQQLRALQLSQTQRMVYSWAHVRGQGCCCRGDGCGWYVLQQSSRQRILRAQLNRTSRILHSADNRNAATSTDLLMSRGQYRGDGSKEFLLLQNSRRPPVCALSISMDKTGQIWLYFILILNVS